MANPHDSFSAGYRQGHLDGMSSAPQPDPNHHGNDRPPLRRRVVAWGLGLFSTFAVGVLTSDNVLSSLCGVMPSQVESVSSFVCPVEAQKVAQADAEEAIDSYLGTASGASPGNAWAMLSTHARGNWSSKREFVDALDRTLWWERVGPVAEVKARGALNRYLVTYYSFTGRNSESPDGDVNVYIQQFQLERTRGGVKIYELGRIKRDDSLPWIFPTIYLESVAGESLRGFAAPTLEATDGGDPTLAAGGIVRPFCVLRMEDGSWIRTTLGWIPDEFVRGGADAMSKAADCDPHLKTLPDVEDDIVQ